MGQIKSHQPVKLIIGFIFQKEAILNNAKRIIEGQFGKIDFESQTFPFSHTIYYEAELGKNLQRKFIALKKLILPSALPKIKIITNRFENKLSAGKSRLINIDPGYLTLSKVVLASTKDYRHRIYIDKGIYAEVTLFFQNKTFVAWNWTYPDYKTNECIEIFNRIRKIYTEQIKAK